VRRIEEAIFRAHFRNAWIAALPGTNADSVQLVAFDDDQRVLGASRAARHALDLSDSSIDAGVPLSQFIRLDIDAARSIETPQLLHSSDGAPIGHGRISVPQTRTKTTTGFHRRREMTGDARYDALLRLAGTDPALQRNVKRLMLVADEDIPVLLRGETGSGKDMFARAIHAASHRTRGNYIALNCAALPESLIDAELFGYEAGAFTGARRDGSKGLIVQASGGTLFLDEIGDMPLALQTRLLRVLENREVWPLGALKPVRADIRLISATHRDLDAMVTDGSFRADLYYRIRGLQVKLPALRERTDKAAIVAQIAAEDAPRVRLSPPAWDALMAYPFPGNMRQLRHVLRLAACTAEGGVIMEEDLDLPPCGADRQAIEPSAADFEQAERNVVLQALRASGGNVADAARLLKISRATLYRKLKALGIAATQH
jgi:transcriptional regulator of acetoin/glycerol metabolism